MSRKRSNKVSVAEWRRRTKTKSIIYKGGSCIVCGYNLCHAALDFHHLDESTKQFNVSSCGICRAWLKVKAELDKCALLCNRCHKEHHYGDLDLSLHLHKNPSIVQGDQALRDEGFDPYFSYTEKWDAETGMIIPKGPNLCIDCKTPIYRTSTKCRSCDAKRPRKTKIEWPDIEKLIELVRESSFLGVAKELGVSDNAIRKRIRSRSSVDPKDLV